MPKGFDTGSRSRADARAAQLPVAAVGEPDTRTGRSAAVRAWRVAMGIENRYLKS